MQTNLRKQLRDSMRCFSQKNLTFSASKLFSVLFPRSMRSKSNLSAAHSPRRRQNGLAHVSHVSHRFASISLDRVGSCAKERRKKGPTIWRHRVTELHQAFTLVKFFGNGIGGQSQIELENCEILRILLL